MLVVGIVLNIVGLGFFCWVLFTLAIDALPFFIGLTASMYAHQAGTGPLRTIALGLVAGAFAVVLGQLVFSTVRAPILRITIALIFAAPAALAGYHATYGLSGLHHLVRSLPGGLRRDRRDRHWRDGVDTGCGIPARCFGRA